MSDKTDEDDQKEKSGMGFGAALTIGSLMLLGAIFLSAIHPLLGMPIPFLILLMVMMRIDWK